MNVNELIGLPANHVLRTLSEQMKQYQNPFQGLSEQLRLHTDAMKPLSKTIGEVMLPFQSQLNDLSKHLQLQTRDLMPFSDRLGDALKGSFRPIIPPDIAADISKAMQPAIDSWTEVSARLSEHFKTMNGMQTAFRNVLLDSVQLNALAAAFQTIKDGPTDDIRPRDNFTTTVRELGLTSDDIDAINVDKLDIIIDTLDRIENSVKSLKGESTIREKLLSIEAIFFYISLILTIAIYLDQKKDQENLSQQQIIFNNKIDTVNARVEMVLDELHQLDRRICTRDTYIYQKPNTKSKIITSVSRFEVITLDAGEVTTAHKWLKIKYLDAKSDSTKCGWALKKYFRKY